MSSTTSLSPPNEISTTLLISSSYIICCSVLLIFMILGISLFYSGLTQRRSAFSILTIPLLIAPLIFIDWFIWGYSLCYSPSSNKYIGNLNFVGLRHLETEIFQTNRGEILALNHFVFNGLFKIICASLAFPCISERGRLGPMLVFLFLWSVLVFNPITYWHWNQKGWLYNLPILEYAGGDVIHCVSGVTALTYSYFLGKRHEIILKNYRNSSSGLIVIGTVFCLIGWLGFNSGCVYQLSFQTFIVLINTLISGFIASFSWLLLDYYTSGKLTIIGFCSGLISGLVVITPGAGYVSIWSSFVFGLLAGILCNLSTRIKYWIKIDDSLDIFAIHGMGGILGSLLTGLFANKNIPSIGNESINGGWINHNYIQLLYQFIGSVSTFAYVFAMSFILLFSINKIPGLHLRVDHETEIMGMDSCQFGEYMNDYVEFLRILSPDEFELADSEKLD